MGSGEVSEVAFGVYARDHRVNEGAVAVSCPKLELAAGGVLRFPAGTLLDKTGGAFAACLRSA